MVLRDEEARRKNAEIQRRFVARRLAGPDAIAFRKYRTEKAARWRRQHREAARAQEAVTQAVYRGKLSKPTACEGCGTETLLDGHHPDYSRPLDVRWLCRLCHKATHRQEKLTMDQTGYPGVDENTFLLAMDGNSPALPEGEYPGVTTDALAGSSTAGFGKVEKKK